MNAQAAAFSPGLNVCSTLLIPCIRPGSFVCPLHMPSPVVNGGGQSHNTIGITERRIPDLDSGRRHYSRRNHKPRASVDPFSGPSVIPKPAPKSLPDGSHAVVWLRNDLRIRDHASFALANTADIISPIYVFDTAQYGPDHLSPHGFQRTGPHRAAFQVEAIKDVRNELRKRRSDLIIRQGDPVPELISIIRELAKANLGTIHVIAHKEVTWEEVQHEKRLEQGLTELSKELNVEMYLHFVWDNTLHHLDDLPFNAGGAALQLTFTAYRELIEKEEGPAVRSEIEIPEMFKPFPLHLVMGQKATIISDPLPSLGGDLEVDGLCDPHDFAFPEPRAASDFIGGMVAAEERLNDFVWKIGTIDTYEETKNESGTREGSSKLSPWLSLGCISPRSVYWDVKKYEERKTANGSTYSLILELMRRDYFRWVAASRLFAVNGYTGPRYEEESGRKVDDATVKTDAQLSRLQKWIEGQTGAPFVDANMREIAATGFMSNHGRRSVAYFLLQYLEFPDWRAGAEYFQSVLIDFDAASNWGNWASLSGAESDVNVEGKLNIVGEGMEYDPEGWFITRWCPELVDIPAPMIHEPHTLSTPELEDMDVILGETYPEPIVSLPLGPVDKVAKQPLEEIDTAVEKTDLPTPKRLSEDTFDEILVEEELNEEELAFGAGLLEETPLIRDGLD